MLQQTDPLISIVVPIYNGAPWLRRCLDSIQNQTWKNWECLVVNDGSTDESGAICKEYAARDDRFKALEKSNGGVSSARNLALGAASGQYLMFSDADDMLAPHSMEDAITLQTKHPDAMVMWAFTRNEQEFKACCEAPISYTIHRSCDVAWRSDWFHTIWNRIFEFEVIRKNSLLFDETMGSSERVGEDREFVAQYLDFRYCKKEFPIVFAETPRYFYCPDNPTSIMAQTAHKTEKKRLPTPEPDYCARLLTECKKVRQTLDPQNDKRETALYARHYLRCLAFGVWSAHALREPLPKKLFIQPEVKDLLTLCKTHRIYSPYYLLFRLHCDGGLRRLYAWDETYHPNFFRAEEAMYRLFFRGWDR